MAGKRTLTIEILGDHKGLSGVFSVAEKKAGSFAAGIGKAGLAIGAGMATAGLAIGGTLLKIGTDFDSAYDSIRTTTGKSGEELAALEQSFKNVATSVAGVNFDQASQAIGDIAVRTGLAGKPLEDLTAQFLNLSKISETDLGTNVGNLTRVFGDWGISVEDQGAAMDKFWRASQTTGAGIDQLSEQVVSFGAPLRQLGFSFDESLAMLGKWEKEGVNTELVLGGMKKALGNFAKEGKDAPAAFRELIDTISSMKDPTEATQKAIEVFGLKAGPDMAAAIREGRFAYEDYAFAIAFGADTINGAADDTDDWREKLELLKNKAFVALEPLAAKVFGAIGIAIDKATPYVEQGLAWFNDFLPMAVEYVTPYVEKVVAWFQDAIPAAIGVFKDVFEGGKKVVADLADAFGTSEGTILKVLAGITAGLIGIAIAWNAGPGLIVTAIVALVAGFLWAYENVDWFRDGAQKAFKAVKVAFDGVSDAAVWLWGMLQGVWDKSEGLRAFLADVFVKGVELGKKAFDGVTEAAGFLTEAVQGVWDKTEGLREFLGDAFKLGIEAAGKVIEALKGPLDKIVSTIQSIIDKAKTAIDWLTKLNPFGAEVTGKLDLGGSQGDSGYQRNAWGGNVTAGVPTLVGERGRSELFIPSSNGTIVPTGGGGGGVTIVVNGSVLTDRQLTMVVADGLAEAKRRGVKLAFQG